MYSAPLKITFELRPNEILTALNKNELLPNLHFRSILTHIFCQLVSKNELNSSKVFSSAFWTKLYLQGFLHPNYSLGCLNKVLWKTQPTADYQPNLTSNRYLAENFNSLLSVSYGVDSVLLNLMC